MAGINDPESIAEHSFRTAILGYILASLEGADANKVAVMCLFHDTHEARINDTHRVAKRYITLGEGEEQAIREQTERLPEAIAQHVLTFAADYEQKETVESRIAHDADALECLIQAREYQAHGYTDTEDWIINCKAALKTASAKNLAEECLRVEPREWWQGLKKTAEQTIPM